MHDASGNPRLAETESRRAMTETIALDRAASVRSYDADGRLRVEVSNITKATVNGYLGREIPGWQDLGLESEKIYQLWRNPDELAASVETFNSVPVLSEHASVTAEDHRPELVVGATGSDAVWESPYIRNSLIVWAAPAIADVESREACDISAGYRYVPVMTPGVTPEGVRYDGVMTKIVCQHIALVPKGRAGKDVVVGDSALPALTQPLETRRMPHFIPRGALKARDTVVSALRPLIATDADLEPIVQLLTALEAVAGDDNDNEETPAVAAPADGAVDTDDAAAQIKALLDGKVDDETCAKICALVTPVAATDDVPAAFAEKDADKDKDAEKDAKTAQDAALVAEAVKTAVAKVSANFRAARKAEKDVHGHVGTLNGAFDSAEEVYRSALKTLGIDITGVTELAGLRAILKATPLPGSRPSARIAEDSATTDDFSKRYPNASIVKRI